MTPRVTYEGEIILDLAVESSNLGPNISVAGQDIPSFGSRRVRTRLRLREGESNLLAGLLRDDQRKVLSGLTGLMRVPGLRTLFGSTVDEISQTDIVMLLTPHIVRTHELTVDDLAPIHIGTQQNVGLGGPPPLIQPPAVEEPAAAQMPAQPPVPITTATPQFLPPPVGYALAADHDAARDGRDPAGCAGYAAARGSASRHAAARRGHSAAADRTRDASRPGRADQRHRAAGVPHGCRSVHGAAVDRERLADVDGHADGDLQPGGPSRAHRAGRCVHAQRQRDGDLHAAHRRGDGTRRHRRRAQRDQAGASGSGLIGALLFDAVGTGNSLIQVNGVASTPEGTPIPLQFTPASVTVR